MSMPAVIIEGHREITKAPVLYDGRKPHPEGPSVTALVRARHEHHRVGVFDPETGVHVPRLAVHYFMLENALDLRAITPFGRRFLYNTPYLLVVVNWVLPTEHELVQDPDGSLRERMLDQGEPLFAWVPGSLLEVCAPFRPGDQASYLSVLKSTLEGAG